MELHNPRDLSLPVITIEKSKERKKVENDLRVKNLINSNLLLNKELNHLLVKIFGITKEINKLIELKAEYNNLVGKIDRKEIMPLFYLEWKLKRKPNEKEREEIKKELARHRKKLYNKIKNRISGLSNQTQKELDKFEKEKRTKIDILSSINVNFCKNCKKIFCFDRFQSDKCDCGEEINRPTQIESLSVHRFGKNMLRFIDKNMWLEHGIDYLLRRKNFETLCGCQIMGHSGSLHEIDNFGKLKSENLRIFCECKDTDIKENDIFKFSGKMRDCGCFKGYIFTTAFNTLKKINHLARSNNITIIDQILERSDNEIISNIQEGPQIEIKKC